jgi:hypothetical protein
MQMSGARCSYGRGRVTEGGIEGDVHPKASMVCSQKHFVKREVTSGLNSKAGRHPNTIGIFREFLLKVEGAGLPCWAKRTSRRFSAEKHREIEDNRVSSFPSSTTKMCTPLSRDWWISELMSWRKASLGHLYHIWNEEQVISYLHELIWPEFSKLIKPMGTISYDVWW